MRDFVPRPYFFYEFWSTTAVRIRHAQRMLAFDYPFVEPAELNDGFTRDPLQIIGNSWCNNYQ